MICFVEETRREEIDTDVSEKFILVLSTGEKIVCVRDDFLKYSFLFSRSNLL